MERDDRSQHIQRRAFVLGSLKIALTSLIVGRMYYLQVIDAKKYRLLAEKNRLTWRFLAGARGQMLDRNGIEITGTQAAFHLVVAQDAVKEIESIIANLQPILPLTPEQQEKILKSIHHNPAFIPTILKDNLSWQEVTRFELNAVNIPGVYIQAGHRRVYHFQEIYAPITGYVAMPAREDVRDNPLLRIPGLRVGKEGLEKQYQEFLQGKPAYEQLEVDAHNHVVRKLSESPGESGQHLHLTIDHRLQVMCHDLIKVHPAGSCVILDPSSGAVRAFVSHPSFDPNNFIDGISHENWDALQDKLLHPLQNRPLSGLFAPGSCFKMVVALAGLESGIIRPHDHVTCHGGMTLGTHLFHCWQKHGHGTVNLVNALASSCDVYFYEMALKIGVDRIADMASRFGLGAPTGIDLPGEKGGCVPHCSWKRAKYGQPWYKGDTVNFSIGQGYLTATPLQLATMTAALANGGFKVTPHFVADEVPEPASLYINPTHMALIHQGMAKVTGHPSGTAFQAALKVGGFDGAGKTGSSQVRRITLEDRRLNLHKSMNRVWIEREHALFVGFAPLQNPQYAISLIIEHGGSGSRIAAPLGCQLLKYALSL